MNAPSSASSERTRRHFRDEVTQAICCECGTVRATTGRGGTGEGRPEFMEARCVVRRKCATCKRTTTHAYLRADIYKDDAEATQAPPILTRDEGMLGIDAQLEQLGVLGVRVDDADDSWREESGADGVWVADLTQWLDDGSWCLTIDRTQSVKHLQLTLNEVWDRILNAESTTWFVETGTPGDPSAPPRRYVGMRLVGKIRGN